MITAPRPGDDWTDPTTGERLTIGHVDELENEISFARWGHYGPHVERTTITDFFERFMRPNLPDDSEV